METQPTREQIRQARRYASEFIKLIAQEGARRGALEPATSQVLSAAAEIARQHGLEKTLSGLVSTYMTIAATAAINLPVNLRGRLPDPAGVLESAAKQIRENMTELREARELPTDTVAFWAGDHGQGGRA